MPESPRTSSYSANDKICLAYRDETNQLVHLYYSPAQYFRRQALFGTVTYPQPPDHGPA